jgi:tetratricopeptide (TPR) repeat protein
VKLPQKRAFNDVGNVWPGGTIRLPLYLKSDKHIFRTYFLEFMRLVYAFFILLLILIPSVQCQQTAEGWFNKGKVLSNQSNYSEAIIAYDEAIKLNPNYATAWSSKGIARGNLGKVR